MTLIQDQLLGAELRAASATLAGGLSQPADGASTEESPFVQAYTRALALQEQAAGQAPDLQRESLLAACTAYQEASRLAGHTHVAALYNHGVALSDLYRLGDNDDGDDGRATLRAALDRYGAALALDPANPQALNNSGLALQELASGLPPAEAGPLLRQAVARFRGAARALPGFHRALYNAGTALYSLAAALRAAEGVDSADLLQQEPALLPTAPGDPAADEDSATLDVVPEPARRVRRVRRAFADAAQYIALACALRPVTDASAVYARSLDTVAPLLPLPALRRSGARWAAGPPGGRTPGWARGTLELDAAGVRSLGPGAALRLGAAELRGACRARDPSLPAEGHALWLALTGRPRGAFLVLDGEEEAECWVDALATLAHLNAHQGLDRLARILRARPPSALGNGPSSEV
ncbi:CGL142 [Auxenochlorella protothecoides x Auxenochlorella symbiontica]